LTSALRKLFLKADHRSNIRNAPLPNSNIDEVFEFAWKRPLHLTENYQ